MVALEIEMFKKIQEIAAGLQSTQNKKRETGELYVSKVKQ